MTDSPRARPGDVQFCYNHAMCHDRRGFTDHAEPEQVSHSPRSGKVERPSDTSGSEYRPRIMPQKTMASSRAADAKVTASAIAALLK